MTDIAVTEDVFSEDNTDSNRKLATIQRIEKLEPIINPKTDLEADSIELATVLGWKCVVGKGQYTPGDLTVFIEIDSVLPQEPWAAEANARSSRVKTIRLLGQISQGLCYRLDEVLPDWAIRTGYLDNFGTLIDVGADVTNILGITKYKPKYTAKGNVNCGMPKGNFPSFLSKTDETRIQGVKRVLERYAGEFFYATEKLDGSSMTAYISNVDQGGSFGVCSRNLDLSPDGGGDFWGTARRLELEEKLRRVGKNVAIQGELIGPGIQGNKYNLKEKEFRAFNAFDIDTHSYYDYEKFVHLCAELGIPTVPIVPIPSSSVWDIQFRLEHTLDDLVKFSTRKSALNPQVWAEGIVIRPVNERYCDILKGRLSFKVINPEFLLKNKDA